MPPHPAFSNGFDNLASAFIGYSPQGKVDLINKEINDICKTFKSDEELIAALSMTPNGEISKKSVQNVIQRAKLTFYTEGPIRASLYENGCNFFKIESEHWDESKSRKTIEKFQVSDFRLPFDTCAIDITGASWAGKYTLALISTYDDGNGDKQLIIRLENDNEDWFCYFIPYVETFKLGLSLVSLTEEDKDVAYKILSIMMYAAAFKREKNRFVEREVKARRSPRLPSYKINEVRLIQPEYFITGKRGGKGSSHTQFYRVKGHWRAQPVGKRDENKIKTIWIKPFWKGKGREAAIKTYKV